RTEVQHHLMNKSHILSISVFCRFIMFQVVRYVFDYKQICDFSCSSLFHVVALCATIGVVNGVVNCDDRIQNYEQST
ncbi:hypothetical protein LQE34_RS25080, partial [Escherichia coli]